MKIDTWLSTAAARLVAAGIETARLDVLVLLEDCLGRDRASLLAHPETELSTEHIGVLANQIERRCVHEPLAYIRGRTEFYGRVFTVNNNVLEPRPETEAMIELLRTLSINDGVTIVDVGTGSGALAITAKLEYSSATVIATDINPACLEVCQANAEHLEADIRLVTSDLLADVENSLLAGSILLCNLPYVPDGFPINPAARHEPGSALYGGTDGLDLYRRMFEQLQLIPGTGAADQSIQLPELPAALLTESLPEQHEELARFASESGYQLVTADDFIQVFSPR